MEEYSANKTDLIFSTLQNNLKQTAWIIFIYFKCISKNIYNRIWKQMHVS